MYTVTKSYRDLPAAHRQPNHDGHCRLIHGHNWAFDITFGCDSLDENGFVIDVGKLEKVKEFLVGTFDHTLLLNSDDPHLPFLSDSLSDAISRFAGSPFAFAKVVVVPNCGMEGLAKFVQEQVNVIVGKLQGKRVLYVVEVICWEDSKNRAAYHI